MASSACNSFAQIFFLETLVIVGMPQECFMTTSLLVTQILNTYTQVLRLNKVIIFDDSSRISWSETFFLNFKVVFFFFFFKLSAWQWRIQWPLVQFGALLRWQQSYPPLFLYQGEYTVRRENNVWVLLE